MKLFSLITSFVAGALSIFYYVLINYLYFHDFGFIETGRIIFATYYGYFDYLLLPLTIVIGLAIYRWKNKIIVTYKKLLKMGCQTTLLAAFLFSAFIFVALKYTSPDYFQELITRIKEMNS